MGAGQEQLEDIMRQPAEILFRHELEALRKEDTGKIPAGWQMSPQSVLKFIVGGKAGKTEITPKYIGNQRLIEMAVATLVTDRALLLIGEPGTAKSWLSENLAAAIYGNSGLVVQGTAGTSEEHVRYSWNYAMLLAQGPTPKRWCRARSCGRWKRAGSPGSKRFPAAPRRYRMPSSPFCPKRRYQCLNSEKK